MSAGAPWFGVRRELPQRRQGLLVLLSFALPLALWCAVSYLPWLWHPQVAVRDPGASAFLQAGMLVDRAVFAEENAKLALAGAAQASGERANPVFLPPPHAVAVGVVTAFTTPPRKGSPWLHESLLHSIRIIALGFAIACLIGVPLGILCGTYHAVSRLAEPFVDFIRYMPAPAFGALAVAVLGINDAPKIAIIAIGTFFPLVLTVAHTARRLEPALLEAAQTLGANDRQLLTRVVVPGILPHLYTDLRLLLGCAWTYLIIAELIGASSGISWFINQQGKYRAYDLVFAGIIVIGLVGILTDAALAWMGRVLFPWHGAPPGRASVLAWSALTWPLRSAMSAAGAALRRMRANLAASAAARRPAAASRPAPRSAP